MSKIPSTNVVAVFDDPADAAEAVQGLRAEGFDKDRIAVMPQGTQTEVSVQADSRQAEAAEALSDDGASSVQSVAR